jgi:hypothetical protein
MVPHSGPPADQAARRTAPGSHGPIPRPRPSVGEGSLRGSAWDHVGSTPRDRLQVQAHVVAAVPSPPIGREALVQERGGGRQVPRSRRRPSAANTSWLRRTSLRYIPRRRDFLLLAHGRSVCSGGASLPGSVPDARLSWACQRNRGGIDVVPSGAAASATAHRSAVQLRRESKPTAASISSPPARGLGEHVGAGKPVLEQPVEDRTQLRT